jgi:hypothetical protein
MDELIKKVAEAFRDYVINSDEFRRNVANLVEDKFSQMAVNDDDHVKELVSKAVGDIDWEDIITDNLDTSSNAFESGVKDVVRDMELRVEVR